ncbi:molybdenum cofactor biosynthesis protein MoaE [Archaeoglobus profundus]|uniref:Molybdopterin biosynthesis MoaE protein n=1 Tax=Archaeoglobus profundus (strain DSM 5631 / JCM 9629 / NBRC 100127 / Av18) TaxID=572546 RepID=D2RDT3_ARCPA|nr:molybdenum cofactor biosynthesis protein MoaE [Archaeoglobus profundus]ADB58277.1 molybdopterin biosynthesis MoaE protein [Archaeoglobus profundus DSM 5631]
MKVDRVDRSDIVVIKSGEFYEVYEKGELVAKFSTKFDILKVLSSMGYDNLNVEGVKNYESPLAIFNKLMRENDGTYGALAIFTGIVKEFTDGKKVKYVKVNVDVEELEKKIKSLSSDAKVVLYHRNGSLKPKEPILHLGIMTKTRFELFNLLSRAVDLIKEEHSKGFVEVYES